MVGSSCPGPTAASFATRSARCSECIARTASVICSASPAPPNIEHFEQRSRAPAKTFDWSNLFWSCSQPHHCGKRKDELAGTYHLPDVVKPDVDEPRRFLQFLSDGRITVRANVGSAEQKRAAETIRVFGLDVRSLCAVRAAYLVEPLRHALEVAECFGESDADAMTYLREVAADYAATAFSAAILDVLGVPVG